LDADYRIIQFNKHMKTFKQLFLFVLCLSVLSACRNRNSNSSVTSVDNVYENDDMWCSCPSVCDGKVDVFYVVSTMVMQSFNPDGTESFVALLTDEEKEILAGEINHVHSNIIPDNVNFFAPYYHQMTMDSYDSTKVSRAQLMENAGKAKEEVCAAFDYYMEHCNNGRPFIIAGYSQGSIMVKTLVQHLTDEQYERMVAAYMIGFGLNDNDLNGKNMKAARRSDDLGVVISWNSMDSVDKVWDNILSGAVTCMNPVTMIPDNEERVAYDFDGEELTVHVDNNLHVLIVEGLSQEKHDLPTYSITPYPDGNYHSYELYLYNPYIRQNMIDRIAAYEMSASVNSSR